MSRVKKIPVGAGRRTQRAEPSKATYWRYLLRMPTPLAERLRDFAETNGNTLCTEVLNAVEFYLDLNAHARLLKSAKANRRTLTAELFTAVDRYLIETDR